MSILITGGTGFVGLALAEHFMKAGEKVVLFGLPVAPSIAQRFSERVAALGHCRVIEGDVRARASIDAALEAGFAADGDNGSDATDSTVAGDPIHCVIHAAAVTPSLQRERDDAAGVTSVNVLGTVNVIEAVAAHAHIRSLVMLSSVAVYGNPPAAASGYIEEDHCPPLPSSLYGITKLAVELLLQRLAIVHGLRTAIVRVGPVYGPWEHATGVRDILSPPQQVLDAALRGDGTVIVLPADAQADFVYVRDVAAGIAAIAQATDHAAEATTEIFNLAGGKRVGLAEWCEVLSPLIPSFQWRIADAVVDADAETSATIVHTVPKGRAPLGMQKLKDRTGFVPRFDLAAAASDYLAWLAGYA